MDLARPALPLAALLALSACANTQASAPPAQAKPGPARPRLADPGYLPPEARELLTNRMARHRENGALLMDAVVLLDYDGAKVAAVELAGEAQLARPTPGAEDTLNARLPPRFFDLQEQLVAQARTVQGAAEARDPAQLGQAYANMVQTCVACHAAYLGDARHRP